MGQIPILLRSRDKVQMEMDLYATAYNPTRLKNIETVPVLPEKLAKWISSSRFSAFFAWLHFFFSKKEVLSLFCYKDFCSCFFFDFYSMS
jgi:hypothetical protein